MASTNASINFLVTGITKIDRALEKVDQIDAIVSKLNKKPIDISRNTAAKALEGIEIRYNELARTAEKAGKEIQDVQNQIARNTESLSKKQESFFKLKTPGTKIYKQLESDIKSLASSIDELSEKEDELNKKRASAQRAVAGTSFALERSKKNRDAINELQNLADAYLAVGDAQRRSAVGKASEVGLNTSVAALKEQASLLSLISNSVKIATSDFNRFAVAAELAGSKLAKADQARFTALASGLSAQGPRANFGVNPNLEGSRRLVAEAIKMNESVTRSEAAMESYVGYLERLRSVVPVLSDEYRALEEQIAGVRKEMSSFGLRGQSEMLKIPALQGPVSVLGDPKSIVKKQGYYNKIEDQLSRIVAIETRIDQAFLDQDQKLQLRQKLEKAVNFLAEKRLDAAKRETAEIDRQRMSLERMNRRGQGAAKSAAFSPLDGAKRLNNILASGETLRQKLLTLQVSGVDVTDRLAKLEGALNAAKQEGYEISLKNLGALDDELNSTRQLLQLERARAETKSAAKAASAAAIKANRRLPLSRNTLTSGLIELGRADTAAKVFRGGRSGEQALSDAISALKAATGPQKRGSRVTQKGLPIGAGAATTTEAAGQGISGVASRLAEAGKNAAKSFSDKLRSGMAEAKSAGASIGEAAASGTRESLDIASPSGVYEKYARDVIAGFRNGILAGKGLIQSALDAVFGNPKSYRDAVSLGLKDALTAPATDAGEKVGAFVARSTTKPSTYRKLVGILGDSILSSPAVTEATYRKAYEGGKIVPPVFQSVESRRLMRAENRVPAGVPGSNLENIIMDAAMAKVRASGSLVGPIPGPQIAAGGASSPLNPGVLFSSAGRLRGKTPRQPLGSSVLSVFENPVESSRETLRQSGKDILSKKSALRVSIEEFFAQIRGQLKLAGSSIEQAVSKPFDEVRSGLAFAKESLAQAGLGGMSKPSRVAGRSGGPLANIRSGLNFAQESLLQAGFSGISLEAPKQQAISSGKITGVFSEIRSGLAFAREFLSQAGASGLFGGAGVGGPMQAISAAKSSARSIAASVAANAISINAAAISNIAESTKKAGIDLPLSERRASIGETQATRGRSVIDRRTIGATPPGTEWISSGTFLGKPLIPSSILAPYVPPSASLERNAATRQREIAALEATDSDISSGENKLKDAVKSLFNRISGSVVSAGGAGGGGRPGGPTSPNGPDPEDFEGRVEGARGNAQKLLGLADLADLSSASNKQLQLFAGALAETRDGLKATDAAFGKINKVLDRTEDALARRDPNSDLLVRGFGRRGGQAVGEGLIGGAFPLLFGQGGGAAAFGGLGGALGGFAGGTLGFGLSLVGTAIGSQVDALAQAAQDTGNILRDLTGNFEKIKESGLLVSRGQERLVENLLEAGNKTAAYAILQAELNKKIGVEGAAKLIAAADAGDRLKRAMADLGVQMQLFIAGPLAAFLDRMTSILGEWNKTGTVATALGQVSGDKQREGLLAALARENVAAGANPQRSGVSLRQGPLGAVPVGPGAFGATGPDLLRDITSNLSTEKVREIVKKFLPPEKPGRQTPEQQRSRNVELAQSNLVGIQRELEIASRGNEAEEIAKTFRQQAIAIRREQQSIDRQGFELRRDYERQIEDIRRGIEDRISQLRQENAQKELEILIKQGQIREQQFKNSAAALQGALAGDPLAQSLADAVMTYLGAQMSAQDQIEQRRKQFEIEITNQQVEADKYRLEVGRTLSRLNTDTAEKVADINRTVAERNEDASLRNFESEKRLAKLRLEVLRAEAKLKAQESAAKIGIEVLSAGASGVQWTEAGMTLIKQTENAINAIRAQDASIASAIQKVESASAPPKLRGVAAPRVQSVSFAGVNQQIAKGGQLLNQLKESEEQLVGLIKSGNLQQFTNDISLLATQGFDQLSESLKSARQQLDLTGGNFKLIFGSITASYQNFVNEAAKQGVPISKELADYLTVVRDAQIELQKLVPTIEFYQAGFSDVSSQIDQAKTSLEELLLPTKVYDRLLAQINSRGGLGINPEDEERLLRNARALDELNARLKALNALNDIASSWTDSFVQLNKELLKGGSLLESVQRFAESVADRTLDVILEFTLRPIQEKLFKGMADMLGIDQAPENPLLLPVKQIEDHVRNLLNQAKKPFADKTGVVLSQQVAPANAIVPGPNAAQRQGYPEYIDKSVLRNWLMSQGMGRTSGDFTNAGHRTPNHMLNAMDMGFIDPKYDNNYVQKTKEMEARLRATGAFGDQLFGPTSDPREHGTHLHVPTPGGRVKVTPGLAELLKLGQPTQSPAMNSGFQVPGSPLDGKPAPLPGSTILRKLIPAAQPPSSRAIPLQVVPPVETQQSSPVAPAADQAAESIGNLDKKAREAADGVQEFGGKMSESVTKFQTIVGTGLQAITSVAMGIGGAQMIRKGGAYNTLMGAASIFGSIGSIAGMFGTGGSLSGLFGRRAPSATASNFMMPELTGVPGGARALGGPVYEGMDYIVGEHGREVIRMGANGTVVPADELYVPGLDDDGSSAPPIGRYSRRAASTMESADMEDGDTIYTGNYGRAVPYQRSETTREIDRLERVTSNPRDLPPIKYETTRVNEYDFVTPEQLEASNSRTAKMARNQTIRELADSMKTRKRLGL